MNISFKPTPWTPDLPSNTNDPTTPTHQGGDAIIPQALESTDLSHHVHVGAAYAQAEPTSSRKKAGNTEDP